MFSSTCELHCCRQRPVPVVQWSKWLASWIGLLVWFVDPNPAFLLLIFFISCLVGEKVVEKSRNRRKDDWQPKICWFLCLVNFLYFLFSLCFSRQPNKTCVILISCFTWFWNKFFDVVFSVDECVAFSIDACVAFSDDQRQWEWGESESESNQRYREKEREKTNKIINESATVTVHISTVTVACINAQFYSHWCGCFLGPKCVKRLHFSILQNYPPADVISLRKKASFSTRDSTTFQCYEFILLF